MTSDISSGISGQEDPSAGGALRFSWDQLATRLPPVPPQARLVRLEPADFQVSEVPSYTPSGQGEHLMLRVEKVGVSTVEVARRIARACSVDPREVGFAGRKDVQAVATQWFTCPLRKATGIESKLGEGVRILESAPHRNKLHLGHLRGNVFDIRLREPVPGALEVITARMDGVRNGVPNYFGPQRFGMGGRNAEEGVALLQGRSRVRDGRQAQLLVSAVQSAVFNRVLDFRLRQDPKLHPLEGDIMAKIPTGALFWCDAPATDAARVDAGEITVTGPLPGSRMREPRNTPLTWESQVLGDVLHDPTILTGGKRPPVGDRRGLLVRPTDVSVRTEGGDIRVTMGLAPGAFATSILREWCGILVEGGDHHGREDA